MDWPLAIDRNRETLKRIVAALFVLAGAASASSQLWGKAVRAADRIGAVMLPRQVCAAILLILRPAESAVRRLIVIAARGLLLKPHASRPLSAVLPAFKSDGAMKTPAFTLLDPLKQFSLDDFDNNALPRFGFHSGSDAAFHVPCQLAIDEPVDASQLLGRIRALRNALNDLHAQARRLVRWQARRDFVLAQTPSRPTRITPFRPGLPPGWRKRPIHDIDHVLRECHGLALYALKRPDTS